MNENCSLDIQDTADQKPELEYFLGVFYEPIMFWHVPVFPLLVEVLCIGSEEGCIQAMNKTQKLFDDSKETAYDFSHQLRVFCREYYGI